jgi:hypothetical protein
MVLRPVPNSESEQYILIGESYIHGIMDRGTMEKLDSGKYELQKIVIV